MAFASDERAARRPCRVVDPSALRSLSRAGGASFASLIAVLAIPWASACHDAPPEPTARPQPESHAVTRAATSSNTGVSPSATAASSSAPAAPAAHGSRDESFRYAAAPRIVAIGDIHGDLRAARRALRLAGAVDADDDWIGKGLVVVQTGDEIDRGDDDRAVIDLFSRLAEKAKSAGGSVHALNGNHEVMNVAGDFRYVTAGGFSAFSSPSAMQAVGVALDRFPPEARGRAAAFSPGGPYARVLAGRDAVVVVGDTVFVHGGITADHVRYGLGRLNAEIRRWMKGGGDPPALAEDPDGPLWTRRYSDDAAGIDCDALTAALAALGAKRMVVGHTPHADGISAACGERLWRIDSGMSAFYGGPTEVLDIQGDRVTVKKGDAKRE